MPGGRIESSVIEAHLLKIRARDALSREEEAAIRGAVGAVKEIPADTTLVRAGDKLSVSILLLEGILCRYKDLRDGQRQISELHVAGDFADLHGFTLKRLDHSVMALTRCRVAIVPHERLTAITRDHPHLTRIYWFLTNVDAAIHREWVLSLGRRTAISRLAHLFCELHFRLGLVGLADETGYALNLTQVDLAECLGLTPVHVNRVLRELRERGLVEFRGGRVAIRDRPGLERVAEFDPSYLYLEHRPR
ncbi:MAG TPA: Crp/Fnr family transcriptional regulator [Allosphingosinicella sp.]|nr:Crp/Fnr family transcriptional regulator [Allosphingosinicella sp.]